MAVTADGWLDWATRLIPSNPHTNPGKSSVRGVFYHSAEGYASVLLDPNSRWGYNGNHSWHGTNLKDGRFYQHYPLTARCWHASAANQEYAGFENEGRGADLQGNRLPPGRYEELTDAQVVNLIRLSKDVAAWRGWELSRPRGPRDKDFTLWEHNEVTRLGGTSTSCPSGRIPWGKILVGANAAGEDMTEQRQADTWAEFFKGLVIREGMTQDIWATHDFGVEARRYKIELATKSGVAVVYHGNSGAQAGRIGWRDAAQPDLQIIDVEPSELGWFSIVAEVGDVEFDFAHCVAYWT